MERGFLPLVSFFGVARAGGGTVPFFLFFFFFLHVLAHFYFVAASCGSCGTGPGGVSLLPALFFFFLLPCFVSVKLGPQKFAARDSKNVN